MTRVGKLMRAVTGAGLMSALLGACVPVASYPPMDAPVAASTPPVTVGATLTPEQAARNFVSVVNRIEPVAEAYCRERNPSANCDFQIVIDNRPNQPPNAFQTVDRAGRPLIGFTLTLIADARNADEIAFVVGHESAHHIAGHIPQTQAKAQTGAVLAGILAQATGASVDQVRSAQQMGASMGARTYARNFELEADALGAEIAYRAGYDPLRGAAFFDRMPDPGDRFLGTHPRNSQRKETVARAVARMR
jgi:predicted Zn-dependent protease